MGLIVYFNGIQLNIFDSMHIHRFIFFSFIHYQHAFDYPSFCLFVFFFLFFCNERLSKNHLIVTSMTVGITLNR